MKTLLVAFGTAAFVSFGVPGLASAQSLSVALIPNAVGFTLSNGNASNPAHQNVHVPGFALFPGIRRRLEIPWQPGDDPESIVVKSKDFSFERKLPLDHQ
jgi:hypothetical protein